ncbi:MAG: AraC family transcriptional regulator [Rikenellaceae bacterium]
MELLLLKNMLFASSVVMYAYGVFSFLTISPKGKEYYNYRVAREIFGAYMIFVATCLLGHWHFDLRQQNPLLATSLCLLYFTPGSMIFAIIFSSLIQSDYPFRKRLKEAALCTLCLVILLTVNYLFIPEGAQHIALIAAAILYIITATILIVRFYRLYRETLRKAENYYSDNINKLFKWIPITIYVTLLLAFAIYILSFITNVSIIPLFLLMGILIYTSIFISLQNHMMNIAKIKMILLTSEHENIALSSTEQLYSDTIEMKCRDSKAVKKKLDKWIENKGFTQQGLTLDDLATELNTNRTYLSSYINECYNLTFRAWITSQRIEYSKKLLQDEDLLSASIAVMIGYSPNAFIKTFTKAEGMTPTQWRSENKKK